MSTNSTTKISSEKIRDPRLCYRRWRRIEIRIGLQNHTTSDSHMRTYNSQISSGWNPKKCVKPIGSKAERTALADSLWSGRCCLNVLRQARCPAKFRSTGNMSTGIYHITTWEKQMSVPLVSAGPKNGKVFHVSNVQSTYYDIPLY